MGARPAANAINDQGQIAGDGLLNGQLHGFLLTSGTDPRAGAPKAPSGLAVNMASTSELDLAWTDSSNNELRFELQVKQSGGDWTGAGTVPANQASFAHTGLASYTHFTYRVRAVNNAGASDWSNEASGDTGLQAHAEFSPARRSRLRQPGGGDGERGADGDDHQYGQRAAEPGRRDDRRGERERVRDLGREPGGQGAGAGGERLAFAAVHAGGRRGAGRGADDRRTTDRTARTSRS